MNSFQSMGLPEQLLANLQYMQFNEPTPIQSQAIPLVLAGHDILGSAQTGTGKTGAFGIPLVARLMSKPTGSALIMTPTRELAVQVYEQIQKLLGRKSKIQSALLIGGESMPKQISQLRRQPRVIIGTPGRINNHLERRTLKLFDTDYLVLDETDRMLDMGFSIQIKSILEHLPQEHQTLLFSATLPKEIIKISEQYLKEPKRVAVAPPSSPAEKVVQETLEITDGEKFTTLLDQLAERDGSVIIFVKTKNGADRMAERLHKNQYRAYAIHGDLPQGKRQRVIENFRKEKFNILVATDIAARGLDISHIMHVINYDLPQCPEDYIHRIGRTARAGADGFALNLVTPNDRRKWQAIERLLNPDMPRAKPERKRTTKKSASSRSTERSAKPKRQGGSSERSVAPVSDRKRPTRGKASPERSTEWDKRAKRSKTEKRYDVQPAVEQSPVRKKSVPSEKLWEDYKQQATTKQHRSVKRSSDRQSERSRRSETGTRSSSSSRRSGRSEGYGLVARQSSSRRREAWR